MPKPKRYFPPPLKTRVWMRNPSDRPASAATDYGDSTEPVFEDGWGVMLWAFKYDRYPETVIEEAVTVLVQRTVWTIRHRVDVDPDVEFVHGEKVYRAIGPAVERGGPGFGLRARYLEIQTELRT